MKVQKAERAEFNVPTCGNIAVCQLCRERKPFRSHGASSSQWLHKQRPRFAQGQPKGYFQRKELDRTTKAIVPMNKMWRMLNANMHQYVSLRANMGQHCSLQLCRERQPFRSHGTSSSQGWRKRIVVQSEFDP